VKIEPDLPFQLVDVPERGDFRIKVEMIAQGKRRPSLESAAGGDFEGSRIDEASSRSKSSLKTRSGG
jgi:hypothetical protein